MNQCKALKDRQEKELKTVTLFFAFSKEQLEKGMAEFGLSPDDTDAIFSLNRTGRYFRLSDETRLREMLCRHNRELWAAVEADETGAGFILDMFAC